jgi:4-amino-4-deoxy-L-arabinose transferase-like glycosyltransferase
MSIRILFERLKRILTDVVSGVWMRRTAVVGLLALHALLLAQSALQNSPVWDEPGHLAAGVSHWYLRNFDLYRVNPPLVRVIASLPVLPLSPDFNWKLCSPRPDARSECDVAREWTNRLGIKCLWFFTLARWACIPLSLIGAYVCFRWARELYGEVAGIAAMGLWCFDPNILAHGQLLTPDVGAAAFAVAASYAFWRWLREPTWMQTLIAGVLLGLAELTKTTLLVFFALWPVLLVAWRWPERTALAWREWRRQSLQLAAMLVLGVYLINFGYGFEGSFRKLGDYRFVSKALGGPPNTADAASHVRNRFAATWLASLPVPLPANYVMGIDSQKSDFESNPPSFLCGEWRRGGWWYYYLYALAIKVPLGTWLLVLLAVVVTVLRGKYSASWRDELVLLAPLVVVLVLVSSQTGMNHHMRYVLPIFPFAFVWMSKVARAVDLKQWRLAAIVIASLGWSMADSMSVYPHSLSYFNELAGGPKGGHWHLHNSNIDWGQDLLYLKAWYETHPEARPLGVAYFALCDPRIAGIEWIAVPRVAVESADGAYVASESRGPLPGWYALSVNEIHRHSGEYEYFLRFQPVAMAGYSIYIYHITLEEANQVRRELGLPELDAADGKAE